VEDWSGVLLEPLFGLEVLFGLLLLGLLLVELVDEELEFMSVLLPVVASVDLWCFLCFFVVVVSPLASVEVELLVELWVLSEVEPVLPDCAPDCAASLCGIVLLEPLFRSLLVFAAASPVIGLSVFSFASEGLWFAASAGFVGVCSCAIRWGVVEELLSACGVVVVLSGVLLLGVVELASGVVVVVVVVFVVVLLVSAPVLPAALPAPAPL
jgi:hypothetical protein